MSESRNRRPGFPQDPFDALFNPRFWSEFESKLLGGIEKTFRGIEIRRKDEVLSEATQDTPAEKKAFLIATLDVPGVAKEDVKITFSELDYGFTRLSITTKRGGSETLYKTEFRETVVASEARATVELGVLTVKVPLKEGDTRSTVEVPLS